MPLEDTEEFKEMISMDFKHFNEILNLIASDITIQKIVGGNKVISGAKQLTVKLRFLAIGEMFHSLSFQFRISDRAISYIVNEVYNVLKVLSAEEEWLSVDEKFETRCQYPNAIKAINGKYVVSQKPSQGGPYYYYYKRSNSNSAIAGLSYECFYADVGTNGRVNDGDV